MSDPEVLNQPLIRGSSHQTDVNVELNGQRSRSSRGYKVAGLTLLACVLIVGQATTAYFLLSQRSDIKSLQGQTNKMKMALTEARSVSVPVAMHSPISPLSLIPDEETVSRTAETQSGPLTSCQLETAGLKPVQVPGFRPVCDKLGLYQRQQCYAGQCWCVKPTTGEMIKSTVQTGPAHCSSTGVLGEALQFPEIDDVLEK